MASSIPSSLKHADISQFALRASQLETAKPIISYWLKYFILQRLITKGLHSEDAEATAYTGSLMDKLETFKAANEGDERVMNDFAAKVHVEHFALDIFQKAENAQKADRVSKQTADTFLASATFLEVLSIWDQLDAEIVKKIKFAKFHALRIAKAIKAGEDPNLTNPQPESDPEVEGLQPPPLDPNDPEVQAIAGNDDLKALQPSVVDADNEPTPLQPDHPTVTNGSVSPMHEDPMEFYNTSKATEHHTDAVSPISPPRQPSIGGNYFPTMPDPSQPQIPSAPTSRPGDPMETDIELPSAPLLAAPSQPPPLIAHTLDPPSGTRSRTVSMGSQYQSMPPTPAVPVIPLTEQTSMLPPTPGAPVIPQAPVAPGFMPPPGMEIAPSLISTPAVQQPPSLAPPPQLQSPFATPSIQRTHTPLVPPGAPDARSNHVHTPVQHTQAQVKRAMPTPNVVKAAPITTPQVPASASATINGSSNVDEAAMLRAQKNAKWANSALQFEDVPTAIAQFIEGLSNLGVKVDLRQ